MKISLKNLTSVVWKNILIIGFFTILGGLVFGAYAQHKKNTTFIAERNVVVAHKYDAENANQQVMADMSLSKTYEKMIESDNVAKVAWGKLNKKLKRQYSISDIKGMISAKGIDQSLVITIGIRSSTPKDSTKIVNAVAEASKIELPKMSPVVGTVDLFSPAKSVNAVSHTTPSSKKYVLLGASLGLLFGMVLAFTITTWKQII